MNEDYFWSDGQKMGNTLLLNYYPGSKKGENINYIYPSRPVNYESQKISEDGTIGKKKIHSYYLIVNPKDKTPEGYKIIDFVCYF